MNARQRRKLVRKHKDLIAQYKVMRRLNGGHACWTDYELAATPERMRVMITHWSTKHETIK